MNDKNMNRRDWSDALGERLRNAEVSPSSEVWQRVALSASSINRQPRRINIIKWAAAVAAAAIVGGVVINTLHTPAENIAPVEGVATTQPIVEVDESVEADYLTDAASEDRELTSVKRSPEMMVAVADVVEDSTIAPDDVVAIEQSQPREPKRDSSQSSTTQKTTKATPKANAKATQQIIEMPMRRRAGVEGRNMLALNVSGGIKSVNNDIIPATKAIPMSMLSTYGDSQTSVIDSYRASDITHHQPISVTLSFAHPISRGWSVVSGVGYSALISDIEKSGSGSNIKQRLNFIGIPIRFDYHIIGGDRFSLYSGVGAQSEYCISAKVGESSVDERKWHFSTNMVIGGEYRVLEWFSLYCEPDIAYYLTDTNLNTYRSDNQLSFTMRFGVRFTL